MNKIFKVKRNAAGQSVVCSEIAKSHTAGKVTAIAAGITLALVSGGAHALTALEGAKDTGAGYLAVGDGADAAGYSSVAIGTDAVAMEDGTVAIGVGSVSAGGNSVAVGSGHALGNLSLASGGALAKGHNSFAFGAAGMQVGSFEDQAPVTGGSIAEGDYSIALQGSTRGTRAVAINGYANGTDAVAIGGSLVGVDGTSDKSVGIGSGSLVGAGTGNVLLGYGSSVLKDQSVINYGTALGSMSHVVVDNGVAIGSGSYASTEAGQVGYLADGKTDKTWVATSAAVSIGGFENSDSEQVTRQINFLAAGTADTDAVNVAQLKVVKDLVDTKADKTALEELKTQIGNIQPVDVSDKADKSYVDAQNAAQDAQIEALKDTKADKADLEALKENITATVQPALDAKADKAAVDAKNAEQDKSIADNTKAIADNKAAIDGLDGRVTAAENDIASLKDTKADKADVDAKNALQDAIIDGKADKTALAATDAKLAALDAVAVTYDDTTKDTITLAGTDGTTITNVKAGAISANSTDAVNGSQLFDVYNYVNQGNDAMRQHINTVEDKLQAGIAGSNASAALPQVRGNGKSMMAFGLGGFQDKGALAVGYSRSSDNGRTIFKAHLNADTEKQIGGGLGVGFEW